VKVPQQVYHDLLRRGTLNVAVYLLKVVRMMLRLRCPTRDFLRRISHALWCRDVARVRKPPRNQRESRLTWKRVLQLGFAVHNPDFVVERTHQRLDIAGQKKKRPTLRRKRLERFVHGTAADDLLKIIRRERKSCVLQGGFILDAVRHVLRLKPIAGRIHIVRFVPLRVIRIVNWARYFQSAIRARKMARS
jgi:hypothetical protein